MFVIAVELAGDQPHQHKNLDGDSFYKFVNVPHIERGMRMNFHIGERPYGFVVESLEWFDNNGDEPALCVILAEQEYEDYFYERADLENAGWKKGAFSYSER